ncbi:MAG: hypothetical protein Q9190_001548 [Brigantiaea leucoxantha]
MSTGLRFATLPSHPGFPYTMTLTLNPLMGNLSSTYSVRAGDLLSLSTRFDFNVYSYESDVVMGMELWRLEGAGASQSKRNEKVEGEGEIDISGSLKTRLDHHGNVGVLWESRVKELVYSLGATLDLRGGKDMIGGVGVEVRYSS